jgi:hypothetical protein
VRQYNCRTNVHRCRLNLRFPLPASILFLLVASTGCRSERIDTVYGQRSGAAAATSVNGTAVLGEMFELAGHSVFSWRALSPRLLERTDCIVWFPDDFRPPAPAVCECLGQWLDDAPGRTLIYVGRDFDAAPYYWEKIEPAAPPEQSAEIERRLGEARGNFQTQRRLVPDLEIHPWFTVEGRYEPRQVRSLGGDPEWLKGVDAAKLDVELNGRIIPSAWAQVLLESQSDVLLTREPFGDSQLFVVANGSFLLNLPLVNHEHRKLAGKLIDQVGPPGKTIVFLESGPGGPPIVAEDLAERAPTGLEILVTYPIYWAFIQFAIVGVLLCFARWPIFGVPRELESQGTSDFGKHIEALGELLQRSRDRTYAMTRLLHYQQTTKSSTTPTRRASPAATRTTRH